MEGAKINIPQYQNALGIKNQTIRLIWSIVWLLFARLIPRSLFSGWKRFLLRCFGAKIHKTAIVYSSVKIYMPWNLEMEEYACLSPDVDCYNVTKITIGAYSTVSQKSYLCTASHDVTRPDHPLITKEIIIEDQAWIGADAFIGMGVRIGQGAVVGARGCVFKDVEPWTIVGGNPAKLIKKREIRDITESY